MKETASELRSIIWTYSAKMKLLSEDELRFRPSSEKWSRKEVIGHLIDSAQNNLRRFIVGQYDESEIIVYAQDLWVKANKYHEMPSADLIGLWRLLNERICVVLDTMPAELHEKTLNTGKNVPENHSLGWLAADYVKHLKHHLNQVFKNSFDIVYP